MKFNEIDNEDNLHLKEFKREAHAIALREGVDLSKVVIKYHDMTGEYCVYINNKWSGYLYQWFDGNDSEFAANFLNY